ncbi:MAG: hypothetical protein HY047_09420 [Acidobacteria bacterium]|nr:hypothetical protein [Acidobacteriota bacterium]
MTLAFVATITAAVGVEAFVLFTPTSEVRADGQRLYVAPLASGEPVGQTFRLPMDGLESVDLQFSSSAPAAIGLVCRLLGWADLRLSDGSGRWAVIYEWKTTLKLSRGRSGHRFTFKPIDPSSNLVYQFQVQQLNVRSLDSGAGVPAVGLMASEDDAWKGGNLIFGREQIVDRDLFFQARTASEFAMAHLRAGPNLPLKLRPVGLQLALLALLNVALAAFAYELIISGPERSQA